MPICASHAIHFRTLNTTCSHRHPESASRPCHPSKANIPADLACGTGRYTHLLHTLGAYSVTGLDISSSMIAAAKSTYPPTQYPTLSFDVADCSKLLPLSATATGPYDIIFAGWFLNYAGSFRELVSMFKVIAGNLKEWGEGDRRFVGLTTNAHVRGKLATDSVSDFYGLDVEVLDKEYRDPDEPSKVLGVKTKVGMTDSDGKTLVAFECYQFTVEMYESAAKEAGLEIEWKDKVLPEGEWEEGYWDRWLERPNFDVLVARHVKDNCQCQ